MTWWEDCSYRKKKKYEKRGEKRNFFRKGEVKLMGGKREALQGEWAKQYLNPQARESTKRGSKEADLTLRKGGVWGGTER